MAYVNKLLSLIYVLYAEHEIEFFNIFLKGQFFYSLRCDSKISSGRTTEGVSPALMPYLTLSIVCLSYSPVVTRLKSRDHLFPY